MGKMKKALIKFRFWFLEFVDPVQRFISWCSAGDCAATAEWVREIEMKGEPGDIFVCYQRWNLSNIFIPGFYNHAAIMTGPNQIVEAEPKPGVRENDLIDFVMKKDAIALIRPRRVTSQDRFNASQKALDFVGAKYDRTFVVGGKSFFCSEVVYEAYKKTGWSRHFTRRDTFGALTVTPQDFRDACNNTGKAELILEFGRK